MIRFHKAVVEYYHQVVFRYNGDPLTTVAYCRIGIIIANPELIALEGI